MISSSIVRRSPCRNIANSGPFEGQERTISRYIRAFNGVDTYGTFPVIVGNAGDEVEVEFANVTTGAQAFLLDGDIASDRGYIYRGVADTIIWNAAEFSAVYLDGGFKAAFDFIVKQFETPLNIEAVSGIHGDYKSRLQELVQVTSTHIPQYQIVEESGPDHDKTFHTQLHVGDIQTQGIGKSKKLAEQDAARKALELLQKKRTNS